jgi:hypothetical protein
MSGLFIYVPIAVDHVYATIRVGTVLKHRLIYRDQQQR